MGIDIDGGMFIGTHSSEIKNKEFLEADDPYEWVYETGMSFYREYFDCDMESTYIGFDVEDVKVSDIDQAWLDNIKAQGKKFEDLTGTVPYLIGMQDVT